MIGPGFAARALVGELYLLRVGVVVLSIIVLVLCAMVVLG